MCIYQCCLKREIALLIVRRSEALSDAFVSEGMATPAVRLSKLVEIGNSALLELGLAVAAKLAVSMSVVHRDGERVLEGTAAALHVKVEHLSEIVVAVVERGHVLSTDLGLRAHSLSVSGHLHWLCLRFAVPHLQLPLAPPPQHIREGELLRKSRILTVPPAVDIHSQLAEPLVDPRYLVALLNQLEHELGCLGLSALILWIRSVGLAWIH